MKIVLCLFVMFSLTGKAQDVRSSSKTNDSMHNTSVSLNKGVKWTEGLSWMEIKEKAQREKKYIFLDCYTTWCGPCKRMDSEVYVDENVGKYFKDNFISVKVQMDRTKHDDSVVQQWYTDAAEIERHYLVKGYPTFLFFSPAGILVHRETGFANAPKLMGLGQTALIPGKIIQDEYSIYEELMLGYKKGEIRYDKLPFMVDIAKKLGDTVSRELVFIHAKYVSELTPEQRYTETNIKFWSSLNLSPQSNLIGFFWHDANMIDQVMKKEGYSRKQVDKCIQNFIVKPFILEQLKNPEAKSGAVRIDITTGVVIANETNYDEADWVKLQQLICKDFDSNYVNRNLLQAKANWYEKNSNWIPYVKTSLQKLKQDPPDFDNWLESSGVNSLGWNVFLRINDKDLINESIKWMEILVYKKPTWGACLDTYANLLYKSGRKEDAIEWQERAVKLDSSRKIWLKALDQMKKGEPTYGVNFK